jgi:putative FmdB family regulatory protein
MPIYGFECDACGHHFDRLQKISDPDPTACPDCGVQALRRQLTAPAFRLSGSGWYETDFKKDGDKKRNLVDKGETAPTDPKTTATDSKPAAAEAKSSDSKPAVENKPAAKNDSAAKPDSAPASG